MKKTLITAIAVLACVAAITAYLNKSYIVEKRNMINNAVFSVLTEGQVIAEIDLDFLKNLGEEEFKANLKSSGKEAEEHVYTGVPLIKILEALKLEPDEGRQVIVRAVDGYTVALAGQEVLDNKNTYIVYRRDGEELGQKETGGSGPYQLVIRKDPFGQRWCKYLIEVEIQ